ncbi:GNAT family N-acetyltransferase [uncultured Pseudodesulfovibrio sp.]|uniref:GNAT family N-acetyltransferase n=1 Tax=uncultured Pseudodesulfovibrio sp. TaxID=2035858 RepID=UPI0029C7B1D4|nr:GNAT family N-acetyltransferase [uncultured Pseudodesulfovibrio sp.]
MTATLRRAEPRDIDAICNLLSEHMNSKFPPERWERLFTPSWCMDSNNIGIVAEDNGKIVGFHGHVCSSRPLGMRLERFVNFTSWYVLKEYRGQGLGSAMVRMAISDPETTYMVCSLSPKRVDFYKKLGLDILETERFVWRRDGHEYDNLEFIMDVNQILMRANPAEAKVVEDHLGLDVTPILVSTRCTQCLLLLSITRKKDDVTYYDVLYRSNPALFTSRAKDIAEALLPDDECVFAADCRFVDDDGPGAEVEVIQSPRFYKTSRVDPRDIDLAYSEIVLLDLKVD